MEVITNHAKFHSVRAVKRESEIISTDHDGSKEPHAFRFNSGCRMPYCETSEVHIKPDTDCYENTTSQIHYNGYYENSSNAHEEWSEADVSVKYEYQEPEENFISIDDVKVKPFLFEMMQKKEDASEIEKLNYESIVKNEACNEEDDDVILIEDDDDDDDEEVVDDIDENEIGEELDWMDLEGQDKQSFECFLCNKKVASNYNLRRHMMIHTGERPFGCDICYKRFREFSDLKKHRKVHVNEQGFTCMICRKNVPSTKNATKCSACERLDRQTRSNYGELTLEDIPCIEGSHKKAYVCPVCDRIFGSRHNLKRHYMIHTGEKPFKCDMCGKHFREVSTLKKHMLTHSRIKLFKCVSCGKEYSDFGAYSRHKISHGDTSQHDDPQLIDPNNRDSDDEEYLFECGACYKKFSNLSVYKDHFKLHSSDFTFQCYICKRMFRNKIKLNAHFVTHEHDDSD